MRSHLGATPASRRMFQEADGSWRGYEASSPLWNRGRIRVWRTATVLCQECPCCCWRRRSSVSVRTLAASRATDPQGIGTFSVHLWTGVETPPRYAHWEDPDHECKPSPHRHPSASTSGEKAEQATRADCGGTGERTGCARSKAATNVFTIALLGEGEQAANGGLAPRVTGSD